MAIPTTKHAYRRYRRAILVLISVSLSVLVAWLCWSRFLGIDDRWVHTRNRSVRTALQTRHPVDTSGFGFIASRISPLAG